MSAAGRSEGARSPRGDSAQREGGNMSAARRSEGAQLPLGDSAQREGAT